MKLKISTNLSLPLDAITQTFGVLAVRGAGKTNLAAVMAEEMYRARLPFCVIDPVGAWYGLRSNQDGSGPGLRVPIFGGRHGDVPLERGSGQLVADLVASDRLSCVLDVSEFSEGDKTRFLTDFAERLYRKNEDPLHLFLEEADSFAPQRPFRDQARLLGAWQNIVRRGRARGLGITMITQRSAVLSKDVLTQIETLFVLRTTSPQDRKAIGAWVDYHGQSHEVVDSLPGLSSGEAWVWSPSWLKLCERIKIRRRRTFDSGATPKLAKTKKQPATLADVNLEALRKKMAETIERATADDPKALRRRVAELEAELRKKSVVAKSAETKPGGIERREIDKVLKEHADSMTRLVKAVEQFKSLTASDLKRLDLLARRTESVRSAVDSAVNVLRRMEIARPVISGAALEDMKAAHVERRARMLDETLREVLPIRKRDGSDGTIALKSGERRILAALAFRHPIAVTRAQAGTLSGFRPRGGTFQSYWSRLKQAGLVEEAGGQASITAAGLVEVDAGSVHTPRNQAELVARWKESLKSGEARMLDVVLHSPGGVTREELAERSGFSAAGGTFHSYLSTLRRAGLVVEDGQALRAGEALQL